MIFFKRFLCLFVVAGLLVVLTGCPKTANMGGSIFSDKTESESSEGDKNNKTNPKGVGKSFFEYFNILRRIWIVYEKIYYLKTAYASCGENNLRKTY